MLPISSLPTLADRRKTATLGLRMESPLHAAYTGGVLSKSIPIITGVPSITGRAATDAVSLQPVNESTDSTIKKPPTARQIERRRQSRRGTIAEYENSPANSCESTGLLFSVIIGRTSEVLLPVVRNRRVNHNDVIGRASIVLQAFFKRKAKLRNAVNFA